MPRGGYAKGFVAEEWRVLFSDVIQSVYTKLKSVFSHCCIAYITFGEVQAQTSEGSERHGQPVTVTHKYPYSTWPVQTTMATLRLLCNWP